MYTFETNFVTFGDTSSPLWEALTGPNNNTFTNTIDGDNFLEVNGFWVNTSSLDLQCLGHKVIDFNGTSVLLLEFQEFGSPTVSYYAQVSDPAALEIVLEADANLLDYAPLITTPLTVCFAAGTLIATPEGETAVEALQIGDMVTTADGRAMPVKWIGHQTVQKFYAGDRARPVRVAAGVLGDGLPHIDLVLTADHALILDGLAINAGPLVNGSTIRFDPGPERATYHHIETEDHDVILANGTAVETYVDYVERRVFDNHREYVALYGEERTITEMPMPRISAARLVPPTLRDRFAGRSAA